MEPLASQANVGRARLTRGQNPERPPFTQLKPKREDLLVRRAGFEPATRCLEGSRSIRLSYRRSVTIVQGKGHVLATRRSQCFAVRCH